MLKQADKSRLFKEINVGAWRLDDESKKRVQFAAGTLLRDEIARLLEIIPEQGVIHHCIMDLAAIDPSTGRNALFSLLTDRYSKAGNIDSYDSMDIRIGQGVRLAGEPLRMDSLFFSNNFRDGMKFKGGRKIRPWNADAIFGVIAASPVPEAMPEFDSAYDLLAEVERLCPITDIGIAEFLHQSFPLSVGVESN